MRYKSLLQRFCVLLLFFVVVFGVHAENPARETPSYSRVVLSWEGDPTTTQSVSWRSSLPLSNPVVEVALWGAEPTFGKNAQRVAAKLVESDDASLQSVFHYSVTITGLKPNTTYGYRVGDGETWSEWHKFTTAEAEPGRFKFIYLGDVQNDILSLGARAIREAYSAAPDSKFFVFAGDLVAEGYDDHLWGEWSAATGFLSAIIPSLAVVGNHDAHQPNTEKVEGPHSLFRTHFVFPMNGPSDIKQLREAAYYVDYQNVRFVAIDSNVFANEDYVEEARDKVAKAQTEWLRTVLQNNPNRWTIVIQHHPVFSAGKNRDHATMRELLMPIYQEAGVDLVLQGHDHYYSRTHKIFDGNIADPAGKGVVYVTSVCGSKMYSRNPKFEHLMAVMKGDIQMYQIIEIDQDLLRFRAFAVGGELVDSFDLRKAADGTTTLANNF
ncbi:MAG TPA: metallophosphoesterase family protein [Candidatus Hydrogenedentes bacterium]|nr:metallophosphoesterase family protein [Candidatus Hydrogenedentota bacterium]HOL77970.1 metallophosphoesterase family protein [Candidatus Hydrogenedentota bacterium]HPO87403.1 metallophosphoesterase family protein [Candidatus Hydrogenedentota bacterium]